MKKRFTLLFAMLAMLVTTARADNVISATPLTIAKSGSGDLTINLTNTDKVAAVQFKLTLPDGVTVKEDDGTYSGTVNDEGYNIAKGVVASLTNRTEDMMVIGNKTGTGTYVIVLISLSGKTINTGEGSIMGITFLTDGSLAANTYEVQISDIHLALEGSTDDVAQNGISVNLTVTDVQKGDVNGDGDIDAADAVCILKHVVGKETTFIESVADVDGDGSIDAADAVLILKFVVGKISALSRGIDADIDWDNLKDPD